MQIRQAITLITKILRCKRYLVQMHFLAFSARVSKSKTYTVLHFVSALEFVPSSPLSPEEQGSIQDTDPTRRGTGGIMSEL